MENFTPTYMKGLTYVRTTSVYVRTILSEPKFLGCIDNQIFLPMMLCCTLFACTRAPLMKSYNYSKYTIKAGLAQLVARVLYCRVGDHGFGSQGPTNAQG